MKNRDPTRQALASFECTVVGLEVMGDFWSAMRYYTSTAWFRPGRMVSKLESDWKDAAAAFWECIWGQVDPAGWFGEFHLAVNSRTVYGEWARVLSLLVGLIFCAMGVLLMHFGCTQNIPEDGDDMPWFSGTWGTPCTTLQRGQELGIFRYGDKHWGIPKMVWFVLISKQPHYLLEDLEGFSKMRWSFRIDEPVGLIHASMEFIFEPSGSSVKFLILVPWICQLSNFLADV